MFLNASTGRLLPPASYLHEASDLPTIVVPYIGSENHLRLRAPNSDTSTNASTDTSWRNVGADVKPNQAQQQLRLPIHLQLPSARHLRLRRL